MYDLQQQLAARTAIHKQTPMNMSIDFGERLFYVTLCIWRKKCLNRRMIHNTFKILLLSVSVWCAPFRKFCTPSSSSFSWYLLRHSWSLSVNAEENITQDEILVYYQHLWPHIVRLAIPHASIKPCPNTLIMIEKVVACTCISLIRHRGCYIFRCVF